MFGELAKRHDAVPFGAVQLSISRNRTVPQQIQNGTTIQISVPRETGGQRVIQSLEGFP